jgi:hypothetical protein
MWHAGEREITIPGDGMSIWGVCHDVVGSLNDALQTKVVFGLGRVTGLQKTSKYWAVDN